MIIDNNSKLDIQKEIFEANSVLKFTYELQKENSIAFLDVKISNQNSHITTNVYTKPTDSGECINYLGLAPQKYKTGVIKTMLHRAYQISSDWKTFHHEIQRLQQLFTNNNFPMSIIAKEIDAFLNRKTFQPQESQSIEKTIKLYYRNQMTSQYKQEEQNLRKIVQRHINPTANAKIELSIYYKNRKLSNLLIRNKSFTDESNSHVVYKYQCEECQPSRNFYIGYTTTTLKQRALAHTQKGSIKNHNKENHNKKIKTADIIPSMQVIFRSPLKIELQIAEALHIKKEEPPLNNQNEGDTRILHIF